MTLLRDTDFIDRPLTFRGKVSNVYDLGETMIIVVTDRISAFDVVFDELVPDKGRVLNSLSAFWFDMTRDLVPNHEPGGLCIIVAEKGFPLWSILP